MGWTDRMKDWGGANLAFLSEDGEVMTFAIAGEPELIEGKYRGKETQRIGAPVVMLEGFTLLIIGKRLARRLSKHEKDFDKIVFEVIRHGEEGSTDTRYELNICPDANLTKQLLALAKTSVKAEDVQAALSEARQIAMQ